MVVIDQEKCVGCGLCVSDCVASNIRIADGKASIKKSCLQCGHCVSICPKAAVSIPEYDMEDIEEYEAGKFEIDPEQFLRAVKFRRSIRKFKPVKVEEEKLRKLADAGRYTATAVNYQSGQFIFIQEELDKLKELVWDYVEAHKDDKDAQGNRPMLPYLSFNARRKADPKDDYLFRNAPVVVLLTSDRMLDAGLAAQNMEMMAVGYGMGMLYNGFLARVIDVNDEVKKWLGIEGKSICACMLLGYPDVSYVRTAPRKYPQIVIK